MAEDAFDTVFGGFDLEILTVGFALGLVTMMGILNPCFLKSGLIEPVWVSVRDFFFFFYDEIAFSPLAF